MGISKNIKFGVYLEVNSQINYPTLKKNKSMSKRSH